MDSSFAHWGEVQKKSGVQVVRWWDGKRKGIHWGDSLYGDPLTWAAGEVIETKKFQAILKQAQAAIEPPLKPET